MPTVELEKLLIIKQLLDPEYSPYLPDTRKEKISSIYHEEPIIEGLAAVMLDEDERQNECDCVVY